MTDLEKLEVAEKIIDKSFLNITPLIKDKNCIIFTDKNGKPLSPKTTLQELADGLAEYSSLIEIRLVKMKAS